MFRALTQGIAELACAGHRVSGKSRIRKLLLICQGIPSVRTGYAMNDILVST
jgi:hypothetical protein